MLFLAASVLTAIAWSQRPVAEPVRVEDLTQCYGTYLGLDGINVVYTSRVVWTECSPGQMGKGPDGECVAGAWSRPGADFVTWYKPFVDDRCEHCVHSTEDFHLNVIAAHEACHLTGIWDEAEARDCAAKAVANAECFPRTSSGTDP